MHYIDLVFVVVIFGFIYYGFKVGVIKGGAAVVSLVIGLLFATRTMYQLGETFTTVWDVHAVVGAVLAFVIIFFGVILVQVLLVGILWRPGKPAGLFSRFSGATLGAVEAGIYISLVLILLNLYDIPSKETREQSFLYKPIKNFAPQVFDRANSLFPGSTTFHDELKKSFEKFKLTPLD